MTSGRIQFILGSVLGPILFNIFINDLSSVCSANMLLFADDSKLYAPIRNVTDQNMLQCDLNNIFDWCQLNDMSLNTEKCKVFCYGFKNISYEYYIGENVIENVSEIKDLGVIFTQDLKSYTHICNVVNRSYMNLNNLKYCFNFHDKNSFLTVFKLLVRSQLEYCTSVWSPYLKDILLIEKVQRRATKMFRSCRNMTYEQRLEYFNLPTLEQRRRRGDLIETYKIMNSYNIDRDLFFKLKISDYSLRGHNLKFDVDFCKHNQRKNDFVIRVANDWNSLDKNVVNSPSLNVFKSRLIIGV